MAAKDLIERLPRHLKMGELRVFVAVLEHRSFRKAAAALPMTQLAVTQAIAGLEDILEAKLFDRNSNGVEPTVHALQSRRGSWCNCRSICPISPARSAPSG